VTGTDPSGHPWHIAAREYERHEARRGSRFAYERIDPGRTALVVVDMIPFFLEESALARSTVPTVDALATATRAAGGVVAWVLPRSGPPSAWERGFFGTAVAAAYAASGGEGALHERLWPELRPEPGDVWAEKSAASAFFPGRSTLPEQLDERGIETVVVAGSVTSVCCESSARDAATVGYQVIVVADATSDVSDAAHDASLRTLYRSFADVRSAADVLTLLGTAAYDPGDDG
jgi:nicotinamidase-related amidase